MRSGYGGYQHVTQCVRKPAVRSKMQPPIILKSVHYPLAAPDAAYCKIPAYHPRYLIATARLIPGPGTGRAFTSSGKIYINNYIKY